MHRALTRRALVALVAASVMGMYTIHAVPSAAAPPSPPKADIFTPGPINRTPAGGPPHGGFRNGSTRGREIASMRTANSYTFVTSDGDYQTQLFPGSVNYRAGDASWQKIDDSLVPDTAPGYAYQNKANRYHLRLPASLNGAPVRIEEGGEWVSFALVGASGRPVVDGSTATYEGALPGVDAVLTSENDQVKENLLLSSAQSTSTFDYRLQTSPGVTAHLASDGSISFDDGAGKTVFSIPAPVVQDAAESPSLAPQSAYSLSGPKGSQHLTLSVDQNWLTDPARVFPVTVDPSVLALKGASTTQRDCYIASDSASTSFCGTGTTLAVGRSSTGAIKRALLRFDVSSLPANAQVLDAQLGMYLESSTSTTAKPQIMLRRLNKDWQSTATWNNYSTGNAWTTAGGDFDDTNSYDGPDPALDTQGTINFLGAGLKNFWYPTQLVDSWVDKPSTNNGFILKTANDNGTNPVVNVLQFSSMQNGTSSRWPTLTITWDQGGLGDQKNFEYESRDLNDRTSAKVNVASGNLLVTAKDMHLAGTAGMDLDLTRSYNALIDTADANQTSGNSGSGRVGNGWNLSAGADVGLQFHADGSATFYGPTGARLTFTKNKWDGNVFVSPGGVDAKLDKSGPSTAPYVVTFHQSLMKYEFSSGGYLVDQRDKNDNTITHNYDANNNLLSVGDSKGGFSLFSYTNNKLTQIQDPAGRLYKYAYTGNNLTSYTDPSNFVTSYEYNSNNELTKITDGRGNQTTFTYKTYPDRRVATMTQITNVANQTGDTTSFAYSTSPSNLTDAAGNSVTACCRTTVTDARSHDTTYDSNHMNRVVLVTDALGHKRAGVQYNSQANVEQYVNAKQGRFTFKYDNSGIDPTSGFTSQSTDGTNGDGTPVGKKSTTAYNDSNHPHLPTCVIDAEGNKTFYAYDSKGNLTDVKAGATATSCATAPTLESSITSHYSYTYNTNGTVATTTTGLGNKTTTTGDGVTTYTYDTHGNVQRVDYPTGSSHGPVQYTYDSLNRLSTTTNGRNQVTTYGYDAEDRLTQISYGTGGSVVYGYDADGNLATRVDSTGTTNYTYDTKNELTQRGYPNGSTTTFTYDGVGNMTTQTDSTLPSGQRTTTYRYNTVNLMDQLTEPDNTSVTTFSYDNDDNHTQTSFPNGVTWNSTYNDTGDVTGVSATGPGSTTLMNLTYDYGSGNSAKDQIQKTIDLNDSRGPTKILYGYGSMNRLTSAAKSMRDDATNAVIDGYQYTYTYDADSNMLTKQVGSNTTQKFDYVGIDELACVHTASTCLTGDPGTNKYSTTGDGLTTTTWTDAGMRSFTYNEASQLTKIAPPGGAGLNLGYADADQTERVSKGATTFSYDLLGLKSQTASSNTTYFTRDEKGNMLEERVPNGSGGFNRYYYVVDGLGSVIALTDSTGARVGGADYKYDPYGDQLNSPTDTTLQANPWRYAGGYMDSETGFYKFGARYYNPNIGRWNEPDPKKGSLSDPMSMNPYLYANDNPINATDPDGHNPLILGLVGIVAGIVVTGVLQALGLNDVLSAAIGGCVGGIVAGIGIPPAWPLACLAGALAGIAFT